MAFHHVAIATKDAQANHDFYTRVMGFKLVKTVVAPTPPDGSGWARHLFYDTGNGELIAFWDLHDPQIGDGWKADHAKSLGLPIWVNHIAFDAPTREALDARRLQWQENGIEVLEVDHEWCVSIYATDPNGVMVEFCHTTRAFVADEVADSERLLRDRKPPLEEIPPKATVHPPLRRTADGSRQSVHLAPPPAASAGAEESASAR